MRVRDRETEKEILDLIKEKPCSAKTIIEKLGIVSSSCYKYLKRLEGENKIFPQFSDEGKIYTIIRNSSEFDEEEFKQLLDYLKGKNKLQREQSAEEIRKMCGHKIIPLTYIKEIISIIQEEKNNLILYELLESLNRILPNAKVRNDYQIVNEIKNLGDRLVKITKSKVYDCTPKRVALILIASIQDKEVVPELLEIVKISTDTEYKKIGGEVEYAIGKLALIDMYNVRKQLYDLFPMVKEKIQQRIKQIFARTELQP